MKSLKDVNSKPPCEFVVFVVGVVDDKRAEGIDPVCNDGKIDVEETVAVLNDCSCLVAESGTIPL